MSNVAALNFTSNADFSLTPSEIAQVWDTALQDGVRDGDFLSKFEGPEGSSKPIIVKNDLNGVRGNQINFTVKAGLVGDGKIGSSTLRGNEEKQALYTYSLTLDFHRHAVAIDERYRQFRAAAIGSDVKAELTDDTSAWMGHHKQDDALTQLVKAGAYTTTGIANNLFWAGNAKSDADLSPNGLLSTGEYRLARRKGIALGLRPFNLSANEDPTKGYYKLMCIGTTDGLDGLGNDDGWINANSLARPRENGADADNPLFTGCYGDRGNGQFQ